MERKNIKKELRDVFRDKDALDLWPLQKEVDAHNDNLVQAEILLELRAPLAEASGFRDEVIDNIYRPFVTATKVPDAQWLEHTIGTMMRQEMELMGAVIIGSQLKELEAKIRFHANELMKEIRRRNG